MARPEPLVYRYGRHFALGAEPTALVWHKDIAAVALGDGRVLWIAAGQDPEAVEVHGGAILSACIHPGGAGIVTGGDDGRVCHVAPGGVVGEIGRFDRKWAEHLVSSRAAGLIVAGVGKEAVVWMKGAGAPSHRYAVGSTIGGLSLDAKGKRLGITHYGGATLVYGTNPSSGRTPLAHGGSHLACTMSPDGRFLITALQETGLHGWHLPDLCDMRMSGYTAKTRSFSWDRRGRWLATSGDEQVVVWPFDGRSGPMGRAPALLAGRSGALVTQVAFHPERDILAVGYNDGVVALARMADQEMALLDGPGGSVGALAWNDAGTRLGWGSEGGRIGIINLDELA